jgi:hypothetical protein
MTQRSDHRTRMTTLQYQVLLRYEVNNVGLASYLASIPDLGCQATGSSPDEAIKASRNQALRKLQEYDGSPCTPPRPSRLSLTEVDLPAPQRHLRPIPAYSQA